MAGWRKALSAAGAASIATLLKLMTHFAAYFFNDKLFSRDILNILCCYILCSSSYLFKAWLLEGEEAASIGAPAPTLLKWHGPAKSCVYVINKALLRHLNHYCRAAIYYNVLRLLPVFSFTMSHQCDYGGIAFSPTRCLSWRHSCLYILHSPSSEEIASTTTAMAAWQK